MMTKKSSAESDRTPVIRATLYVGFPWSKEFLEAGKKRLSGETAREATSDEVVIPPLIIDIKSRGAPLFRV